MILASVRQAIVFRGLPGTRSLPFSFRPHQACRDRVAFDITDSLFQFTRRAYPMIIGFGLPKRLAAFQEPVRDAACPTFQPSHNVRHWDVGLPYGVNVIRHDSPGVKVIRAADGRTVQEGVLDHCDDARVAQPERSRAASIKCFIAKLKRNTACVFGGEDFWSTRRLRSGKAPGDEHDAVLGKPMREMAAIEHHCDNGRPQKTMACPTGLVCPTGKNLL